MRIQKMFLAVAMASALTVSACGSDDTTETTAPAAEATSEDMADDDMADDTSDDMSDDMGDDMGDDEAAETEEMADPAAGLVGAGCADYAEAVPEGAGSVEGMAQDPVAVAAGNNPLLTTLTAAVSGELNPEVDLVDTLNGDEFTVFAPVDDAFAAVDPATIETLSTDAELLTTVLTYHVVPGQLSPEDVVGEQTTVQGGTLEVSGEGDMLMVNDATVICGGVVTDNATVYLVDAVLIPQE
jgi:uncharacterized surface protein with fasciclin (FAS1) repeats